MYVRLRLCRLQPLGAAAAEQRPDDQSVLRRRVTCNEYSHEYSLLYVGALGPEAELILVCAEELRDVEEKIYLIVMISIEC